MFPGWTPGTTSNTAADLPDVGIQDAVDQASSEVDTFLSGPYDPTDDIPDVIRFWTRDIAAYYATLTWRKGMDLTPQDPVQLRYNTAITRLQSVSEGQLDIPSPTAPADVATVVNPLGLTNVQLFSPFEFDLTGRNAGLSLFPLHYARGVGLWWFSNEW